MYKIPIMVYTTVSIILGIHLNREELKEILRVDELGEFDEFDRDLEHKIINKNVEIFKIPCCESENKQYFVGLQMHTYYRKHGIKCDNCDKYSCCDNCIGQTNNGFYDIVRMADNPVEVNSQHVCLHCFSDNKRDLGGLSEDLPVIDHRCIGSDNPPGLSRCDTCGLKPDWRFSVENCLKKNCFYGDLEDFFSSFDSARHKPIKFYYCLNDCLCCS